MIKKISPNEAKEIINSKSGVTLLDVRTVSEYNEVRIPGSLLIPVDEISGQVLSKLENKDGEIIVYCRSGVRSAKAAKELEALGYKNIYDVGGIIDWPYETES